MKKTIWIDISNGPHVLFFKPLINFLEKDSVVGAINKAYLNFNSLSKNGRKYYKANFSDKRMVEDYIGLYSHQMERNYKWSCS